MSQLSESAMFRHEVLNLYFKLKESLESEFQCSVEYGGSLRRYDGDDDGSRKYGDLDLIVVNQTGVFTKEFIDRCISFGKYKRFGARKGTILINGFQVDFNATDLESVDAMRLTCIGDSQFNQLIRARAAKLGFKLNDYGLYDRNSCELLARTQVEIFNRLGIRYYSYNERNFRDRKKFFFGKIKSK